MVCKIALRSLDIVSERGRGCFVWVAASFDLDHREWRRIALVGLLVERIILAVSRRTKGDRLRSRPADEPTRQAAFWATCHLLDESRHHPATLKRHRLDTIHVESGFE